MNLLTHGLVSTMDYLSRRSEVPSPYYESCLHYGAVNVKISEDGPDRSGVYRCANLTDEEHEACMHDWYHGPHCLEIIQQNCMQWPLRHAMAYRTIHSNRTEMQEVAPGKTVPWSILYLNDPTYLTYGDLWKRVTAFGKGLRELGLKPGDRVAIYEDTRWEWLTTMLGLWTQGMIGVTVYANLGHDALVYALEEADCRAIVCNGSKVAALLRQLRRQSSSPLHTPRSTTGNTEASTKKETSTEPNTRAMKDTLPPARASGNETMFIYLDALPDEVAVEDDDDILHNPSQTSNRADIAAAAAAAPPHHHHHRVVAWRRVLHLGQGSRFDYHIPTDKHAGVLIMYTSGTTGHPKGVIHSLGSITHGSKALLSRLNELIGHGEEETYVAYLPVAHIFEFVCELIHLMRGVLVCYGSPRTLVDTSVRPCGDLSFYKPFFLIGVPRIFETMKKTVEARLPPPGSLRRRLFDAAYRSRLAALRRGRDVPLYNRHIFAASHAVLGPRLRAICCGGAALAHKTQEWVHVVLGVPLVQGYGLTETVSNGLVQRVGELRHAAGQALRGTELCLVDTEDYRHSDEPHPRGELWIRGPCVFRGYYAQPSMTREALVYEDDDCDHEHDNEDDAEENDRVDVRKAEVCERNGATTVCVIGKDTEKDLTMDSLGGGVATEESSDATFRTTEETTDDDVVDGHTNESVDGRKTKDCPTAGNACRVDTTGAGCSAMTCAKEHRRVRREGNRGPWLRTGDVVQIDRHSGQVSIIGRVKALAKNVLGEYITLESLEALYGMHPLVTPNGVCLLVDPQQPYIAALLLTDEAKAMRFAAEHRIAGVWPEVIGSAAFEAAAVASLTALAKREGRLPFECVRRVRVLNEEWTPENGLVTASMKIRRAQVEKHYATILKELFC